MFDLLLNVESNGNSENNDLRNQSTTRITNVRRYVLKCSCVIFFKVSYLFWIMHLTSTQMVRYPKESWKLTSGNPKIEYSILKIHPRFQSGTFISSSCAITRHDLACLHFHFLSSYTILTWKKCLHNFFYLFYSADVYKRISFRKNIQVEIYH